MSNYYIKHNEFIYEASEKINVDDFQLGSYKEVKTASWDWQIKELQTLEKEQLEHTIKFYNTFPDGLVWLSDVRTKRVTGRNGQYAKRFQSVRKFTPQEFERVLKDLNQNWFVLESNS